MSLIDSNKTLHVTELQQIIFYTLVLVNNEVRCSTHPSEMQFLGAVSNFCFQSFISITPTSHRLLQNDTMEKK